MEQKKIKRIYNWKKDTKLRPEMVCMVPPAHNLPAKVDLRPGFSPVKDQGELGSCTANAAVGGAFEFLEIKAIKAKLAMASSPEEFDPNKFEAGSRLFVYYNERVNEGTVNEDSGAELGDIIEAMTQHGVCPESMWAYDESKFSVKPPQACYDAAAKHKISKGERLVGLQQMKTILASGLPFIFGIYVYESFESDQVASTGMVPMPGPDEQCVGGHEICAAGYDDTKQCLLVRNSWGPDWGVGGYFWLPYSYVQNPNLASDFWVLQK